MLKKIVKTKTVSSLAADDPIRVYTDGGAIGNPGPGGYAVAWMNGAKPKTIVGSARYTTNNRMELTAIECALRKCPLDWSIVICSDSQYAIKGITEWRHGWQARNWRNSQGDPVANVDLWKAIIKRLNKRNGTVKFAWVKGHSGEPMNELVDRLANGKARRGGQQ